ncbi:MAG TPA: alpha/beta hydrolase [Acidimicrobiales bacterium]|nr:alpha/beta hydrolase [Acidimicrobiales bacterium]
MITAARHEGTIRVREGRQLGIAEFGPPDGRAVVWFHGTPGARRQIPEEARLIAGAEGIRIIGIDRPGVGLSTPHLYDSIADHPADVEIVADRLGLDRFSVIGLSGGGPYALAAAWAFPDRVPSAGILGGVVPAVGPNAMQGGLVGVASRFSKVLPIVREPLGIALTTFVRLSKPVGLPMLLAYKAVSPEGDRSVLERPEFQAMFLDDLSTNGGRSMRAVVYDAILFTRDWGFDPTEIQQPVWWWHGDADHIIPFAHGQELAAKLPNATLRVRHGESHLGGLGAAHEVLQTVLSAW